MPTIPIFNNGFDLSQATCTINGIPCAESVRDYYESADRQSGPDLSKTYFCDWSDRFTVANSCLGLTTVSGGKGGPITFNPPLQHPEILTCYCSSLRITGKGRPYQGPVQLAYPVAAIQVNFKAYPWSFQGLDDPGGLQDIDPDTSFVYATQEIDQGEETLEVPSSALLRAAGRAPSRSMSIPFAHAIMRITFEKMPYLPVNTLPYYNNTNASTFLGCAKGKVRFKGSQTRRTAQIDGSVSQTVTNTYQYRPVQDWNYFINPDVGATGTPPLWEQWTFKDGSNLFPYADLTQTFPSLNYLGS